MVKGLDVFRQFFAGHENQFVLIGGTSATSAMEGAGLDFRATKDLDINDLIIHGSHVAEGLRWIGAEQLIPLKARAWLDLSHRKRRGDTVDGKDIRKHGNDVIRLSQLLTANLRIDLALTIRADMSAFLDGLAHDNTYDPRQLRINATTQQILERVSATYNLFNRPASPPAGRRLT